MSAKNSSHELFVSEALELIDDLERAVRRLEKVRSDQSQLEEVFRVMHSFKGTAKMFGFSRIGEFTHYLENIFDALMRGVVSMSDEIFEVTVHAVHHIRHLVHAADEYDVVRHESHMLAVKQLTALTLEPVPAQEGDGRLYLVSFKPSVDFFRAGHNPLSFIYELSSMGHIHIRTHTDRMPSMEEYSVDATYLYWTILVFTEAGRQSIENEFLEVEDLCEVSVSEVANVNWLLRPGFKEYIDNITGDITLESLHGYVHAGADDQPEAVSIADAWQSVTVDSGRVDRITRLVSDLTSAQRKLMTIARKTENSALRDVTATTEHLTRRLQIETSGVSLFPVSHLFRRFERMVRETSTELHKRVRLTLHGSDIELDANVLKRLVDPMMHMLRNCIDHGIELPEVRRSLGKPEMGVIGLTARYSGTSVVLEISDDGGGIDTETLRQKAIEQGLLSDQKEADEKEILDMVFYPGLTTAREVTDVSGRGVGMDVVRHVVRNLQGEIEVISQKNVGTRFRLKLPLSSGIMNGLLVTVAGDTFVIPLAVVQRCVEVQRRAIEPDADNMILFDGESQFHLPLRKLFNCPDAISETVALVFVEHPSGLVAIEVDRVVDQRQVVIKPVGNVRWMADFAAGAAILDDGGVSFVIDTDHLLQKHLDGRS